MQFLNIIRSFVHLLWMGITIVPWTAAVLISSFFVPQAKVYNIAVGWLAEVIRSARVILGIKLNVIGQENLPTNATEPVILMVKHQSTWETFCVPVLMPKPIAYIFKKELLHVPFFGWGVSRLDMVHIDRANRSEAFAKLSEQGARLLKKGTWVAIFPEGTRVPRGQKAPYKLGGARLAVATGALVVPIAVTSAKCWPCKAIFKQPGTVDFSIGPVISSVGREPESLMAEVERWIETEVQRLDPAAYEAH